MQYHWRHFIEATLLKARYKLLLSTMVETTITSNAVFFPQRKKQMGGEVCALAMAKQFVQLKQLSSYSASPLYIGKKSSSCQSY